MMRLIPLIISLFFVMLFASRAFSLDPPHDVTKTVDCMDCHTPHRAPGPGMTSYETNENLCLSCHVSGGLANNKPFQGSMQAVPRISGTSHKWTGSMPSSSSPSNPYGLRAPQDLSYDALKQRLSIFNNVVVCSVCHDQHSQVHPPWDPSAPSYGGSGTGSGRHFQRLPNDINQLCEDCHFYRVSTHTRVEGDDPSYPPDGVNLFSHPAGQALNENSKNYDRTAPLDSNGLPQSGTRYTGDADGNPTNNLVFDASGKVRCLTCHRIHYSDSNSLTVDGP
jgi:predicted CXXCH cytochrome family protein